MGFMQFKTDIPIRELIQFNNIFSRIFSPTVGDAIAIKWLNPESGNCSGALDPIWLAYTSFCRGEKVNRWSFLSFWCLYASQNGSWAKTKKFFFANFRARRVLAQLIQQLIKLNELPLTSSVICFSSTKWGINKPDRIQRSRAAAGFWIQPFYGDDVTDRWTKHFGKNIFELGQLSSWGISFEIHKTH